MKRLHCLFASYFDVNKLKLDFKGFRQSVNSKIIPEWEFTTIEQPFEQ